MILIFNIVGCVFGAVGAVLSIIDEVKGRSFWRNRGQWILLAGFLFLIVPRYGWVMAVACDLILFAAIALYRTKWWAMTKAGDLGNWVYEKSIGRFVDWPAAPKSSGKSSDDHSN